MGGDGKLGMRGEEMRRECVCNLESDRMVWVERKRRRAEVIAVDYFACREIPIIGSSGATTDHTKAEAFIRTS